MNEQSLFLSLPQILMLIIENQISTFLFVHIQWTHLIAQNILLIQQSLYFQTLLFNQILMQTYFSTQLFRVVNVLVVGTRNHFHHALRLWLQLLNYFLPLASFQLPLYIFIHVFFFLVIYFLIFLEINMFLLLMNWLILQ